MKTTVYTFPLEFQVDEQAAEICKLHLQQFIENFNNCFGHYPTTQQLDGAFKFMDAFFKEVNETYPGNPFERAIQKLEFLTGSPAAGTISERMAHMGSHCTTTPSAVWFEP